MKSRLTIICILFMFSSLRAQDIHFSQFYQMPALRNPALAGIFKGDVRATGIFRSQWQPAFGQFQTTGLGVETKAAVNEYSEDYYSLGLVVTNDVAGDARLGKTQILPSFTFHKLLNPENNLYLSAGFMGGVVQQRFDPSKLRLGDQFVNGSYSQLNPTRQTFNNTNLIYLDALAGLVIGGEAAQKYNYYLGVSYAHFNRPKVAFTATNDVRLNSRIGINGGFSASASDFDYFYFYADYFMMGGASLAQGGVLYTRHLLEEVEDPTYAISFGLFNRLNDAVIPMVRLDYAKLSFGFTYDVNVSKLSAASKLQGGAEATISYKTFLLNSRNSSASKMRCPRL
jgi:type IX secretion system PorP/SprF family membrane protein